MVADFAGEVHGNVNYFLIQVIKAASKEGYLYNLNILRGLFSRILIN